MHMELILEPIAQLLFSARMRGILSISKEFITVVIMSLHKNSGTVAGTYHDRKELKFTPQTRKWPRSYLKLVVIFFI